MVLARKLAPMVGSEKREKDPRANRVAMAVFPTPVGPRNTILAEAVVIRQYTEASLVGAKIRQELN